LAEQEAWFAGLIDGEGCFTLSIYRQHEKALRFDMVFSISMKEGAWFDAVSRILKSHDIGFNWRNRRNQIEVRVEGHQRVKKLISVVLSYLVVKKPLAKRLLAFPKAPRRNRFMPIDTFYLDEISEIVDYVREFNRGNDRKHKWNSRTIREFYGLK
jgi:LAGLIDADG endonuclease